MNELFCQDNPGVVYTYDISHKIGCLLKALLENDSTWQSLLKTINIVLQQIQQTELSFLRPILPRKKITLFEYWYHCQVGEKYFIVPG